MPKPKTFTTQQAAQELGISMSYVRWICGASRKPDDAGPAIGSKHGPVWIFTLADLKRIRNRPGFGERQRNRT